MSAGGARVLSAFAGELLRRVHGHLGPAAFGRVAQQLLVAGLKRLYPGLHENPAAGTPDCRWRQEGREWAWEVKTTADGSVELGARDLQGLRSDEPRLVVLDVDFPARLWVLQSSDLPEGRLRPDDHAARQREDEARALAAELEAILRRCDVDLITSEAAARELVREMSASLLRAG